MATAADPAKTIHVGGSYTDDDDSLLGDMIHSLMLNDDDGFWDTTDYTTVQENPRRHLNRRARQAANVRVDWLETPEAHIFKADLPGMKKENIKISFEDKYLRINGNRPKLEQVQGPHTWRRIERPKGRFSRRFLLPSPELVEVDKITARFEDGVLTVTVPIQPHQKKTSKHIQVL